MNDMRTLRALLIPLLLAGCHLHGANHVEGGVLGRVVIYRNGVAFYERNASVEDGRLVVHVPRDKVDDFLKSLTVVDRDTNQRLSVSIPRKEADDGSYLAMTLETSDRKHANVRVTYVTEAPAWKPSYRVVVGDKGKVMLEGWAIVDNTTSEDWKGVLVGVGASSAMAFRYDLWSVRRVDRDLLAGEERFAVAPPQSVSPYDDTNANTAEEVASLDAQEVRPGADAAKLEKSGAAATATTSPPAEARAALHGTVTDTKTGEPLAGVTIVATGPSNPGTATAITDERGTYDLDVPPGTYTITMFYADSTTERPNVVVAAGKPTTLVAKLDSQRSHGEVIAIQGRVPTIDPTSTHQGVTIDKNYLKNIPVRGRTFSAAMGSAAGSQREDVAFSGSTSSEDHYYVDGVNTGGSTSEPPKPPPPIKQGDEKLKASVERILAAKRDVVIEVHGRTGGEQAAAARGQAVKNKLVDDGVPASRIHVVPKLGPGESERVRVLAIAPGAKPSAAVTAAPATPRSGSDAPVGESHFYADHPMTVRAGSSAMVAMVHSETEGAVVYYYDPISERGDQRFAFKAVRLDNPTKDTLEAGPVTVYGEGRFIGEGIAEPVPPKASIVVPFAADKQVVVERTGAEDDKIAKLVTVQRGVVTAELQHRRTTSFKVTSRLPEPTTVFLRHKLETGWTLVGEPPPYKRVGDSHLFEVHLGPNETRTIEVAEATPVERTFDLSNPQVLGMMQLFIEEPGASEALKAQITALLVTHHNAADLVDKIETLREQLDEYRARAGELHAQIVTLRAVKTGGELMTALKQKLVETSDRTQKATIALVDTQEQLMLTRVRFQNQLAELRLEEATRPAGSVARSIR